MKGKKIRIGCYVRIVKNKIYFPSMEEVIMNVSSLMGKDRRWIVKYNSVGVVEYSLGESLWRVRFYGFQNPQDVYEKHLVEVEEKEAVIAAL